MKNKFISFPKIGQFRQIVKHVVDESRFSGVDENGDAIFDPTLPIPTLTFEGTVKLHGTNAGVTINRDGDIWAQSRKNVITPEKDNAGFAFFVNSKLDLFKQIFTEVGIRDADYITVFGEWCGGNIQKGIAINGLEKMFVIFAIKHSYNNEEKTNIYLNLNHFSYIRFPEDHIFNIQKFKKFTMKIDFNNPGMIQNDLVAITTEIEKQCPVGKAFLLNVIKENTAYENDGKIWFENENKFTNEMKPQFIDYFKKLRLKNKDGINFIKFHY